MITDYCSFEIAKLLKEKGFDWDCEHYYKPTGEIVWSFHTKGSHHINSSVLYEHQCLAPTHQMAMKWLREMHRKYIDIRYNNQNEEYRFIVFTMVKDKPIDFIHSEYHSTYEEAVEAAIKYCLTNLF